jgi:3-oxoadipate enol-lactonase
VPYVQADGAKINYRFDGDEKKPVLVLSNSLGTNYTMWDDQIPAFSQHFRVLRYDQRGHGGSDVTPGPYSIARLGQDVVAMLDGLKLDKVNFLGLSMGGMTGMWLGIHAGKRFDKLILSNTSAHTTMPDAWTQRIAAVKKDGMEALAATLPDRWFTEGFRKSNPQAVQRICALAAKTSAAGYIACCEAIREMNQLEDTRKITNPTMVIAGASDPATPPAAGKAVADRIPGAKYVELPAAHLSNVELGERYTQEILGFLQGRR